MGGFIEEGNSGLCLQWQILSNPAFQLDDNNNNNNNNNNEEYTKGIRKYLLF